MNEIDFTHVERARAAFDDPHVQRLFALFAERAHGDETVSFVETNPDVLAACPKRHLFGALTTMRAAGYITFKRFKTRDSDISMIVKLTERGRKVLEHE